MAPMDQYLPRDTSLLSGESTDSVEGSPTGEPVAAASLSGPDLSREALFDVHQNSSRSGASPRVSAGLSVPHDFV